MTTAALRPMLGNSKSLESIAGVLAEFDRLGTTRGAARAEPGGASHGQAPPGA